MCGVEQTVQSDVNFLKAEFQFPVWDYEHLTRFRAVNLIMPLHTLQAQVLRWGAMVRVHCVSAAVWSSLLDKEQPPPNDPPLDSGWWDVTGVGDCEVGEVRADQWADNFGPQTLGHWCALHRPVDLHVPVRVARLSRVLPNLREFNREWAPRIRSQGK